MNLIPELIIGPSEGRARTLRICWYTTHFTVATYGPTGFGARYAFATAKHNESRLDLEYDRLLWLGSSCFDLSESEAAQVRMVFEPHGLRIQTRDSAHSVDPSQATDHETAVVVDSCPGDDGGTPPPRFSSFGGSSEVALEEDNCTIVHALTSIEGY